MKLRLQCEECNTRFNIEFLEELTTDLISCPICLSNIKIEKVENENINLDVIPHGNIAHWQNF